MDERQRYEQGMKLRRARSEFGNSCCAGSIRAARQMIPRPPIDLRPTSIFPHPLR